MPFPLKEGYNFNFERCLRPPHFEMAAAEAYTDFYGISYMLRGESIVYAPDFTRIIKAGDITFTPKNVYCRTGFISDEPREHILVKFTDAMVSDLSATFGLESFNDLCSKLPTLHAKKETQNKVLAILAEMEQEWNAYNQYSEPILKGLLHQLIITCIKAYPDENREQTPYPQRMPEALKSAIQYVNLHLKESPSMEETARNVNISSSWLSKIFINCLHTPFSVFVLNQKIMYAQKLLVASKQSIPEIAVESGFSGNAYFSNCFRRTTGLTPMQFRKKNSRCQVKSAP